MFPDIMQNKVGCVPTPDNHPMSANHNVQIIETVKRAEGGYFRFVGGKTKSQDPCTAHSPGRYKRNEFFWIMTPFQHAYAPLGGHAGLHRGSDKDGEFYAPTAQTTPPG